ncbi:MAG: DUF218 domain-containing protein [Epulopiscium sp.]|nr:DUF218 domain-containing protein [Candidatus Epulonipiscium sp.]
MRIKSMSVISKLLLWIQKLFKFALIFVIIFAIIVLLINFYMKTSVKKRIYYSSDDFDFNTDCILVLGAGVRNDRPSNMLEDRLIQGIELYEYEISDRLLMSGDHGRKDYDEVNVMKKFATDRGIPSEHVFMDHAGFSTYESLYRARDIFEAKKIIIVTQEYHLYRALYIADKLGIEAYGVPSDRRVYYGQKYREIREAIARVKDFFFVIFQPEPTYLGETIPISGNGDLTND